MNVNVNAKVGARPVRSPIAKFIILMIAFGWCALTLPAALVTWGFTGRTWMVNGIYSPPPAVSWLSLLAATLATLALLGVL